MGGLSVGEAIGEGFRLIAARPGSVLAWGAVRAVFIVLLWLLMAPLYLARFTEALARMRGQASPQPDFPALMAMQSANLLTTLLGLAVGAVVTCAVFRAVLAPQDNRFAYLRLGASELFFFLLIFGFSVAVVIAFIVCAVPIAILVAILAVAHAKAAAFLLMLALFLVLVGLMIFVFCRLSVAGPMMVADGRFHLMDAWALTRGKAGDLFLIGFGLFLVVVLIEVVLGAIALAIGLAVVGAKFQTLAALFARPPSEIISGLAPVLAAGVVISIPVTGCLQAIIAAPWARAWRDLAGAPPAAAV